jgi:citrate lyase subunit beta/citryl-CoA lyase
MPGNNPGMIQHIPAFGADCVLLDLEDAVSAREKDAARRLVAHFVKEVDFGDIMITVRVNGADTPWFERDLQEIIPSGPFAVRIPKCHSSEDITLADEIISKIESKHNMPPGSVRIHAMIETAHGIEHSYEIASASERVDALTLGGQDLTADMGVQKTREGVELLYARGRIVMAAKAASRLAFDTVWTDIEDTDGLKNESELAVQMGFNGKAAIHPSQIGIINDAYRPNLRELQRAFRIMEAAEQAEREGKGVISVDGRMVDAPIVKRAYALIELGRLYGINGETDL